MTQAQLNRLYEELKAQSRNLRCVKCRSDVWPAWNRGTWDFRCREGFNPEWSSKPDWQAEQLSKLLEKDTKMTQPQAAESSMLARVSQAQGLGLFPEKGNPSQLTLMAQAALAYGLDPLMQEIILYQGKPFITIDGRRRLDANAGHHPSIRFRLLTQDEREFYTEAGALSQGDIAHVCVLTTEWGNTVEAFGRVLAKQRDPNQRGAGFIPTVLYTIEMSQKRAEARARRMAYGPSPRPELLDPIVVVAEDGVIEGELVEHTPEIVVPVRPRPPRSASTAGPVVCPIHNIRMGAHPTEGRCHKLPDGTYCKGGIAMATPNPGEGESEFPDTPLGQLQRAVNQEEMTWQDFQNQVLKMPWEEWVTLGGAADTARIRWESWKQQQIQEEA